MNINIQDLQKSLCSSFCRDVIVSKNQEKIVVSLPLVARDGDRLNAYIVPTNSGWKVSDMGTTMMRLSYDHDLSKLLSGSRLDLFESTVSESGLKEDEGEIFVETSGDNLVKGIFNLGQGITRIEELGLWTRSRVENAFYDDLTRIVYDSAPVGSILQDFILKDVPSAKDYPIDYRIETVGRPLFIFGVNSRDKARLTTIILHYLQQQNVSFDSMAVCSNIDDLPKPDRNRLMNAANDIVANIEDKAAIKKKIEHRLVA